MLVSVGSIEEVILERAKQKMGIDAKVIQAGLFNTTSTGSSLCFNFISDYLLCGHFFKLAKWFLYAMLLQNESVYIDNLQ